MIIQGEQIIEYPLRINSKTLIDTKKIIPYSIVDRSTKQIYYILPMCTQCLFFNKYLVVVEEHKVHLYHYENMTLIKTIEQKIENILFTEKYIFFDLQYIYDLDFNFVKN